MGGDDLGSDDDLYLGIDRGRRHRRAGGSSSSDDESVDASRSGGGGGGGGDANPHDESSSRRGNKRQRQDKPVVPSSGSNDRRSTAGHGDTDSHDAPTDDEQERRLFREAARIQERSIAKQASFVTRICHCHYRLTATGSDDTGNKKESTDESRMPTTTRFTFLPTHLASHYVDPTHSSERSNATEELPYLDKLKRCISAKRLKNWRSSNNKSTGSASRIASPCVIIVCSSARRAVSILKELAPLKLPIAKLFPKNGSVSQQLALLTNNGGSTPVLAVGTPHRLWQLAQQSKSELVQRTQLVVLDALVSSHGATVFTAADTAPHCAAFLLDHIVPQLQKRGDLRIAFS